MDVKKIAGKKVVVKDSLKENQERLRPALAAVGRRFERLVPTGTGRKKLLGGVILA